MIFIIIIGTYRPSEYVSSCTVTYSEGTASVSCVDSTSSVSGYQVLLLQQNGRNNLTVLTIRSGTSVSLPLPSGRYCILELPMELMYSQIRSFIEFIAEDPSTTINYATANVSTPTDVSTATDVGLHNRVPGSTDKNIIISKFWGKVIKFNMTSQCIVQMFLYY